MPQMTAAEFRQALRSAMVGERIEYYVGDLRFDCESRRTMNSGASALRKLVQAYYEDGTILLTQAPIAIPKGERRTWREFSYYATKTRKGGRVKVVELSAA